MVDIVYAVLQGLSYFSISLFLGSLLFVVAAEAVACFRGWRRRRTADRLLESVPEVSYRSLPAGDDGAAPPPSSCVICIAEYQRGEGCFVVPACAHVFHCGCMAGWLRQGKLTCPLCRAAVSAPGQQRCDVVSAAEDMV